MHQIIINPKKSLIVAGAISIALFFFGLFSLHTVNAAVDDQPNSGGDVSRSCGSCGNGGGTITPTPIPRLSMSLSNNLGTVYRGSPVRMTWGVTNGQCYTTGGFGGWAKGSAGNFVSKYSSNGSGNYTATANGTFTFKYTCYGPNGQQTCRTGGGKSGNTTCTPVYAYQSLNRTVTVVEPLPTCSLTASPSTVNPGDTVTLGWTSQYATAAGTITNNVNNQSWSINPQNAAGTRTDTPGQTVTYQLQVQNVAGNTASCYRTVTVNPAAPSATISGTDCTIATGASTCQTLMTWDIKNSASPNVWDKSILPNGKTLSTQASRTNQPFSITYGVHEMHARNLTTSLQFTVVNATCASGSAWNGTVCAASGPVPTATITATDCTIAVGASTCDSSLTWYIQNASTPNTYNQTMGQPYGYSVRQPNYTSPSLYPIAYGTNDIVARDGNAVLAAANAVANATCASGSAWNTSSGICESTAPSSLGVDFSLVTADIAPNYVADPVAGTYSNVAGRVRVQNIGDTDYLLDTNGLMVANAVPVYLELTNLFTGQSGITPPQTTAMPQAAPLMTLKGTTSNPPNGQVSSYKTTNTFNPAIPFGTHDFCAYAARNQQTGAYESWDIDSTNNSNCFSYTFPVPQPTMILTSDKELVRVNDTVDLTYDIDVTYDIDCTLRGPGGVNTGSLNFKNLNKQTITTNPLTSTSKFVLTCTEPLTSTVFTKELTVEVVPDLEEI